MKVLILFFVLVSCSYISLRAQHTCSHAVQRSMKSSGSGSDSLDVLHYDINLDIIYLSQKSIEGHAKLQILPRFNSTKSLSLDLQSLTPDSVFVGENKLSTWAYNDTLLQISLASQVGVDDTLLCTVYYHGNPQKDPSGWGGFYFSSDSVFAFNMGVGMTDDPHNYGRIWYPCVDNFTDRATYDFKIRVKNKNMAICNGTLVSTTNSDNTVSYHWNLKNDIPTYLASVAVGPYEALEDTFYAINGPIPIAIYVPQYQLALAKSSFVNLKKIMEAYEYYYGPYRWERIGYVGVPFSSGAMEHATSIHIGLGYLNGTLDYETLIAHELSHHWFGDLVTCYSAPDMWLNEGWAVFSESTYKEYVYGKEAYKNNIRMESFAVLKETHKKDDGYRAVANIPHEYTYGSTVYDKGGSVAHSIRGYIGNDSLFFGMIRSYMDENAYADQSTIQFRDYITAYTGIDMNDFFDAWVFEPGFSQFALDAYSVSPVSQSEYDVEVKVRQALNNKPIYALSNRLPITFMDNNWRRKDTIVQFSGEKGMETFRLDFEPDAVFIDLEETFADATIDYADIISETGLREYPFSFFKLNVEQITDSCLFQITHNWVKPDDAESSYPGLSVSTRRYWTVAILNQDNITAQGQFKYQRSADLDNDIIISPNDSLVLLYRENAEMPWRSITAVKDGNWIVGHFLVDDLKAGEYTLGSYDANYLNVYDAELEEEISVEVSPNPGKGKIYFKSNYNFSSHIVIYDSVGRRITELQMKPQGKYADVRWTADNLPAGSYHVVLYSEHDTMPIYRTTLIVSE